MFADRAKIIIRSGKGGDGHVSFRRELYVPNGGPDGGDGGRGGDVIFEVDKGLNALTDYRHKRKYAAENGQEGGKKRCHGADGKDIVLKVPEGTVIKEATSGKVIADMSGENQRQIVLKGGRGGKGNMHYATATMQVPKYAQPGQPAQELEVQLELKVIADVGLLGFPNVGKSTFLSRVSNARPQIANYHFTTLNPHLGVVDLDDCNGFVIADIPGLIEGASDGIGLGHEFLRHVERCRLLVHIVDVSGSEGRDPIEDFEKINEELVKFNPELAKQPQIVAGNKIDMAEPEQIERFKKYVEDKGYDYYSICAPIMEGTKELMNAVWNKLQTLPPIKEYEVEEIPLEAIVKDDKGFKISQPEEHYFLVEASWFPKVLKGIDIEDYEALQYMQRVLEKSGIFDALREKGIEEGDVVSLYDIEFEYVP